MDLDTWEVMSVTRILSCSLDLLKLHGMVRYDGNDAGEGILETLLCIGGLYGVPLYESMLGFLLWNGFSPTLVLWLSLSICI
jgi:hypothetical protein